MFSARDKAGSPAFCARDDWKVLCLKPYQQRGCMVYPSCISERHLKITGGKNGGEHCKAIIIQHYQ